MTPQLVEAIRAWRKASKVCEFRGTTQPSPCPITSQAIEWRKAGRNGSLIWYSAMLFLALLHEPLPETPSP